MTMEMQNIVNHLTDVKYNATMMMFEMNQRCRTKNEIGKKGGGTAFQDGDGMRYWVEVGCQKGF